MKVFQTHRNIDYVMDHEIQRKSYNSWSDFDREFYDDERQDLFMKEHFPEFYERYKDFPVPVMKAGLWRICVIYLFGGVYADMDTYCQCDASIFDINKLVIGVENKIHLCDWCFAAPPKHPALREILNVCFEKIHAVEDYREYGEHFVHECTGPDSFTVGIERYLEKKGAKLYPKGKRDKYAGYEDENLKIYPVEVFRDDAVRHLFSGGRINGWTHDVNAHLGKDVRYVDQEVLESVLQGHICVMSHGGVGSTYLRKTLGLPDPHNILVNGKKYCDVHGDGGIVAHFPNPLKTGPRVMIYVYGDVFNAVCSQINRFPLNAGRLINQKGYAISSISEMRGLVDPFNIQKQIENYLSDKYEHDYPIVCLNYEKLDNEVLQQLKQFGVKSFTPYEKKKRNSDWTKLPDKEKAVLLDVYGELDREIKKMPQIIVK